MAAITKTLGTIVEMDSAAAAPAAAATPMGHVRVLSPVQRAQNPGKVVLDLFMSAANPNNKKAQAIFAKAMGYAPNRKPLVKNE